MITLADVYMSRVDDAHFREVMATFHRTSIEIAEGQQYDMDFETRTDVSEAEYIEMIRLKTSLLLACAMKIGAQLAGASDEDAQNLYDFGEKMGLAFQLQDDLLDVYGDPAIFGKKIGGDITCNKKTYMLINALNISNEQQRETLLSWIAKKNFDIEEKIKAVTQIYNEVDIKSICTKRIEQLFEESLSKLDKVNVSTEKKEQLKLFAHNLMGRNH
jgi:geranylgeranyl diphosphate synthase type II